MQEYLYAPWREHYFEQTVKGCVFCHIAHAKRSEDDALGILHKEEGLFIVMNRYPYTPGHFMIIPNVHEDKLEALETQTWLQMSQRAQQGVALLKSALNVEAVNIGMNLGAAAGAGIAEHLHMHLVPRWSRDTNFFTTIAEVRLHSSDFDRIFQTLKEHAPAFFV